MELVGEFLTLDHDKNIWQFFKNNWLEWFPTLGSYSNFAKQCANVWSVKQHIQQFLVNANRDTIHFIDGFPIPVCKYARSGRHKTFKEHADFSYCASANIGQLSECFSMQKVRARDVCHLSHRFIRKILSHNFCCIINKKIGNPPLQFELLISN